MKAAAIALAMVIWLGWATGPSEAGGFRGDGRGHGSRGSGGRHDHRHQYHPQRHNHHRGFPYRPYRPYYPGVVWPSGLVSSSLLVAPEPVYAAPPVYSPPVVYAAPPAPIPRVVEYPGGRYELRGDGVTSPYVWVWVPNPPAAPPAPPPPPAAPPAEAPAPSPAPAEPTRRAVAYRWTDDDGVTTWTDSLDKVPERFRAQAGQSAMPR
jgi:hypothetical protein